MPYTQGGIMNTLLVIIETTLPKQPFIVLGPGPTKQVLAARDTWMSALQQAPIKGVPKVKIQMYGADAIMPLEGSVDGLYSTYVQRWL
jgi:hypothetical protein